MADNVRAECRFHWAIKNESVLGENHGSVTLK